MSYRASPAEEGEQDGGSMTLTKAHIVEGVTSKGFTKKEADRLVGTALEIVKSTLESGEDVLLSGFGKFSVREKARRMARNPKTGEEAVVNERRVVTFRCSPILRAKMNGKR